jgi:hypothetical protein
VARRAKGGEEMSEYAQGVNIGAAIVCILVLVWWVGYQCGKIFGGK